MTVHQCRNDIFSGAHFDEYIADYNYMKAGAIDEDVFRMPDLCNGQKIHKLSHPPALPLRMAALLPSVRIGEGTAHMQPPVCNEAALRQSCARAAYGCSGHSTLCGAVRAPVCRCKLAPRPTESGRAICGICSVRF